MNCLFTKSVAGARGSHVVDYDMWKLVKTIMFGERVDLSSLDNAASSAGARLIFISRLKSRHTFFVAGYTTGH